VRDIYAAPFDVHKYHGSSHVDNMVPLLEEVCAV
jgi:hypothetical protein